MLTIRANQMNQLGVSRREAYEEWLGQQLTARFPLHAAPIGAAGMQAFVTRAIDRADGHAIRSATAVSAFAGFLLEFGENFENLPDNTEALAILEDPDFPGQLKVQLLFECLNNATGGRRLAPPD